MLTVDGIYCAFSLPLQEDRVPLKLQVLKVDVISSASSTQEHVEEMLSDGVHPQQLHTIGKQLSISKVVTVNHYIAKHVNSGKVVVICLDVSMMGLSQSQIGTPSEFIIPYISHDIRSDFIGVDTESSFEYCKATPSSGSCRVKP
jgi:hypothetical protein